jgi:hypothetical protein
MICLEAMDLKLWEYHLILDGYDKNYNLKEKFYLISIPFNLLK